MILLQARLTVRWSGWRDSLAGIKGYELEIYKLVIYGNKLAHHGERAFVRESLRNHETSFTAKLVDPGMIPCWTVNIIIIVFLIL